MPSAGEVSITHNVEEHRFEVRFPEGLAVLEYHYDRAGRLSLDHTEVPPARRHQGVAAHLAKAAFDFASARRLTVVPVCPYVIAYLKSRETDRPAGGGRPS